MEDAVSFSNTRAFSSAIDGLVLPNCFNAVPTTLYERSSSMRLTNNCTTLSFCPLLTKKFNAAARTDELGSFFAIVSIRSSPTVLFTSVNFDAFSMAKARNDQNGSFNPSRISSCAPASLFFVPNCKASFRER